MRRYPKPALLALPLVLALSACGQEAATPDDATSTEAAVDQPETTPAAASEAALPPVEVAAPQAAVPRDTIRGKGGLEEKCLKAVAAEGTTVIGTNRIEESQAAIEVYVNVEGGQAPWRCRGNRDGTVESVEYTQEG